MAAPNRRTVLFVALAGLAATGCGRRGQLEITGETPATIGGPTPPTPPRAAEAATQPAAGAPPLQPAQRRFDPERPVGQTPVLPRGGFVLDPLL